MTEIKILVALFVLFCATSAHAFPEKHYQNQWGTEQGGQTEVVFADHTRADQGWRTSYGG